MTEQLFSIDPKNHKRLEKFFKSAPRKMAVATGMLLTSFAFGTREEILKVLPEKLTIRSEGFMKSRIRVSKSHFRQPIDSQVSEVGSVGIGEFSGWAEQEAGITTKRKRLATMGGRLGSVKKKIPRKFRLRRRFESPTYFPGNSPHHRAIVMLNILQRDHFKDPFLVLGHKTAKPGLYRFKSDRLKMIQDLDPKNLQPKRLAWLSISRARYFASIQMDVEWGKVLKRILKFR
jgi:hypothetical protein